MNKMNVFQVLAVVTLVVASGSLPASAGVKKVELSEIEDQDLAKSIAALQQYLKSKNGSLKARLFGSDSRDLVDQILNAALDLQKGNCGVLAYSWDYDPELLNLGPADECIRAIKTKQDQICESQFIDGEKYQYMRMKKGDRNAVQRLANATFEAFKAEIPSVPYGIEKGDEGLLLYISHNYVMRQLGIGTDANRLFLHNLIDIWEKVMQEDRCQLFGLEGDLYETQFVKPCDAFNLKMNTVYYNYFEQLTRDVPYANYPIHVNRPPRSLLGNKELYYRLLGFRVCRYIDENRKTGLKTAIIRQLKDECLQRAFPNAKF